MLAFICLLFFALTGTWATTGDAYCDSTNTVCFTGTLDNGTVTYEMQLVREEDFGWISLGFGDQMPLSPMVIMWPNGDGSVTMSQRHALGHVTPIVDTAPPRIATVDNSLTKLTGNLTLGFTIPFDAFTNRSMIWAFSNVRPSADPGSNLLMHVAQGVFSLDLSKSSTGSTPTPTSPSTLSFTNAVVASTTALYKPTASSSSPKAPSYEFPSLTHYDKIILLHAIFCTFGFLVFLPAGVLIARWSRTRTSMWFRSHVAVQAFASLPFIVIGWGAAPWAINESQGEHFNDWHKVVGLVLLLLYLLQLCIGTLIHYMKPIQPAPRPLQNYVHVVLGLAIITLAYFQAKNGFEHEWTRATGRPGGGHDVWIIWIIFGVLLIFAYGLGLVFLPRQFRMERSKRLHARLVPVNMQQSRRRDMVSREGRGSSGRHSLV